MKTLFIYGINGEELSLKVTDRMTVAFAAEGQTGDPELSPVYAVRHYGRTGRVSDRRVRYRGPGTDT